MPLLEPFGTLKPHLVGRGFQIEAGVSPRNPRF